MESRNSGKSYQNIQLRPPPIFKASEFANLFEANEEIFRKSLAFRNASELTPRPHKRYMNEMIRSHLKQRDYNRAKRYRSDIKQKRYASNYQVPRLVDSCRIELWSLLTIILDNASNESEWSSVHFEESPNSAQKVLSDSDWDGVLSSQLKLGHQRLHGNSLNSLLSD